MDKLEQFKAWIDSEFSDCSWYFEAQENKYLHLYREDLDDFWSYEETVAWLTWQSRQTELDQQKLLTLDSELHLDAAKEEIERLKGVLDERTKEWLEAIKLGTYFQEAAKPLKDELDEKDKRIESTLAIVSKMAKATNSTAMWAYDLEKALRGEQ